VNSFKPQILEYISTLHCPIKCMGISTWVKLPPPMIFVYLYLRLIPTKLKPRFHCNFDNFFGVVWLADKTQGYWRSIYTKWAYHPIKNNSMCTLEVLIFGTNWSIDGLIIDYIAKFYIIHLLSSSQVARILNNLWKWK